MQKSSCMLLLHPRPWNPIRAYLLYRQHSGGDAWGRRVYVWVRGTTLGESVPHHALQAVLAPRAHGLHTLHLCVSPVQRSATVWHAVR